MGPNFYSIAIQCPCKSFITFLCLRNENNNTDLPRTGDNETALVKTSPLAENRSAHCKLALELFAETIRMIMEMRCVKTESLVVL